MKSIDDIKAGMRDVPDFPVPGIIFKDITPILGDPELFAACIKLFVDRHQGKGIGRIAAIDARGFIFGGAIAKDLGIGFVPIRKKGKLPYASIEESYDLEYGSATLCIHEDAFEKGEKVVIIDDLLATGGTAAATVKLVEAAGGVVVSVDFLVELAFLNGREKLEGYEVFAPVVY
jgi:adenine phosphoribosyltransferase